MQRRNARATGLNVSFALVIPIRNGGELFLRLAESVMSQTHRPAEVILFDTDSSDGAVEKGQAILRSIPTRVVKIRRDQFDHGGTRNAALKLVRQRWVIFMTQDAVCADRNTFAHLMAAIDEPAVIAAYGRQLPHADANPLASTARLFNYPEHAIRQDMAAAATLGIKTWFCSNSFCLWQKAALTQAGGFAEKLILGEDAHAAARLIQAGGAVAYRPDARVFHSHNYSATQEFQRYFDIGVFHSDYAALLFRAGNASREGLKFVLAQASQLWQQRAFWSLLRFPFHVAAKAIGYKLGRKYKLLGLRLSRALSMHKNYWVEGI